MSFSLKGPVGRGPEEVALDFFFGGGGGGGECTAIDSQKKPYVIFMGIGGARGFN